jgi:hypothetical protein
VGKDKRPVSTGVLDAAYRSIRSGHWEPVGIDEEVATG